MVDEKGQEIEDRIKIIQSKLRPPTRMKKWRFSSIEMVLLAYFAFWIVQLSGDNSSYHDYPIYTDLDRIISERNLVVVLIIIFLVMLTGCVRANTLVRLHALMASLLIWSIIAFSFLQTDLNSMRGSVIILAVASGYQFVKLMHWNRGAQ